MTIFEGAVLALFLAIFGPLAFLYGRSLAHRVHAQARRDGGSALRIMAAKLLLPALVALSLALRFSGSELDEWLVRTASGTLRAAISALWLMGSIAGILFFVAIPFVFGRCFALIAVAFGWFQHLEHQPSRSGAAGFRERAARAEPEDDEG
ncbi:hypothetical protein [Aureimonas sp. D3]|uniref:hypothetical protein n=1 Tax=Aureimonas sp. D3 TaxID=1638164 RepID=UPI0007839EE1|nr:hypothetical protein [Aureimonas sp. D3]